MNRQEALKLLNSPRPKAKVKYKTVLFVAVGQSCLLVPSNHPSLGISNNNLVRTSTVVAANAETGIIETENTIYEPWTATYPGMRFFEYAD